MAINRTPRSMSIIRIRDRGTLSPLEVVMICLVAVTVAGGSWFLSAAESKTLVDGAVEWQVESPLRAVVQLLCLDYQFPTIHAGAVKIYILGIGAGLAVLALSIALVAGARGEAPGEESPATSPPPSAPETGVVRPKPHAAPLLAAQVLIAMFLLWSFASSRWSAAPELAIGGSVLLAIHFLWAFALGTGLGSTAVRIASRIIIAVAAVTALIAIWYFYGRNPSLRAKFPFGNPNFLSACLIPGTLLAVTFVCEKLGRTRRPGVGRAVGAALGMLIVIAVTGWAFYLTGSRGPVLGLALGLLAIVFFAVRGPVKLIPVVLAVALVASAWVYYSSLQDELSPHGRSATIRLRTYTWGYAWQMFSDKPLTGHGQGGFVLHGDSHVVNDVLDDPLVFRSRIAHAHNEWLEIMADLGAVGIVLVAMALALTLRAGMATLSGSPSPGERWALLGLMGALVGLVVEEAFGVGLRVSGVPTLFYTVIGLIWAMSGQPSKLRRRLAATRERQIVTTTVGVALSMAILVITQKDFMAARNAYRMEEYLAAGDFEEAIRLARGAQSRLNPQRALTNRYRLSEAHARIARMLQERAVDREARARQSDLVDRKLLALAELDREQSEQHCREGCRALKALVERSPGYLNHGRVEYWLNRISADNAASLEDQGERELALRNATAAIEREVLRQPFNPAIAIDYVGVVGDNLDLKQKIDVLTRPLRYNRITPPYLEVLTHLMNDPAFDGQFQQLLGEARNLVNSTDSAEPENKASEIWAPEKLRLAATIYFTRGELQNAADAARLAARAYKLLAPNARLGAASAHAELADCQFFNDPTNPQPALASAGQALALVPDSLFGRRLREDVKQRMVDYYLAADLETEAEELLKEAAPANVTEEMLVAKLGLRYRELCELLLRRRAALGSGPLSPELTAMVQRWVERALTLSPRDHLAHYLAADLALHQGDGEAVAAHLALALEFGLSPQLAGPFLQAAQEKHPESVPLEELWNALQPFLSIESADAPNAAAAFPDLTLDQP